MSWSLAASAPGNVLVLVGCNQSGCDVFHVDLLEGLWLPRLFASTMVLYSTLDKSFSWGKYQINSREKAIQNKMG